VLRVAEQYAVTDPGRQRRANEDSLLVRAPLFVVADGMGGAQAGEVASRVAIEAFQPGVGGDEEPERELAELAIAANTRIHELSRSNLEQAGMGTTLTAVYVGMDEVAIAHVGDSRAYCLRDGELARLTDDHSLVDELVRQGRLTPEEAEEHPQRSVITRALGPEGTVEVDTRSFRARAGDVYLLCSDGLTTMLSEEEIRDLLISSANLHDAGEALVGAANQAGGRDNITVVLVRLEDVAEAGSGTADLADEATRTDIPVVREPPVEPRRPRSPDGGAQSPSARAAAAARRRRRRLAGTGAVAIAVLALLGAGAYLALQNVYFIGTNQRGLVTMFEGVPFSLPGGLALYSSRYVSGVGASTITPGRRRTVLDHSLRSEANAAALVRSLEHEELE
jgi:serine/threonine protein phosphatase PrpC